MLFMKTNLFSPNLSVPPNNRQNNKKKIPYWLTLKLLICHWWKPQCAHKMQYKSTAYMDTSSQCHCWPSLDFSIFIRGSDVLVAQTRSESSSIILRGVIYHAMGFLLKARLRICCSAAFSNPPWCFAVPSSGLMQVFKNLCCEPSLLHGLHLKKQHCFAVEGVLTQVLLAVQYIDRNLKRSHKHNKAAINSSTRVWKKKKKKIPPLYHRIKVHTVCCAYTGSDCNSFVQILASKQAAFFHSPTHSSLCNSKCGLFIQPA